MLFVPGDVRLHDLESDPASQFHVFSLVNRPHTALAEFPKNTVTAQALEFASAWGLSHGHAIIRGGFLSRCQTRRRDRRSYATNGRKWGLAGARLNEVAWMR